MALKKEHKDLLEQMGNTSYGVALKAFLEEELASIDNVENCTSWDDTLGRAHAKRLIQKLFYFMLDKSHDKRSSAPYT